MKYSSCCKKCNSYQNGTSSRSYLHRYIAAVVPECPYRGPSDFENAGFPIKALGNDEVMRPLPQRTDAKGTMQKMHIASSVSSIHAEILQALSAKLTAEFVRSFCRRNFASMVRFAEVFPDERIVSALLRQLKVQLAGHVPAAEVTWQRKKELPR